MRKSFVCALFVALCSIGSPFYAQGQSERIKFDATMKNKFEVSTEDGKFRFSIRNSRLGLSGTFNEQISYRFMVELSDEGKFKVLDLAAIVSPLKNLRISFGQIGIPLFNPDQIAPGRLLFANRTFLGKYFTKTRELGVSLVYVYDTEIAPLELHVGLFNGGDMYEPAWTNAPSYSAKIIYGGMTGLRGGLKFYRNHNRDKDFAIWGAELRYANRSYKVEAEYFNKRENIISENLSAFVLQGAYSFPLREDRMIKSVTPALRWDSMGYGLLKRGVDVNRLTAGVSFGLTNKPFTSLLRFDYEQYFVREGAVVPMFTNPYMCENKFTVELLLTF